MPITEEALKILLYDFGYKFLMNFSFEILISRPNISFSPRDLDEAPLERNGM